jgi:crotonobetainyl-CoA:carnitine CoA-transferase CaiB-like acyl-CoA transferase
MTDTSHLPLDGVTVVDFSRHLPGPWCTQYLADLGASVIKVEHLGVGDPSRFNPPRYARDSVYFHSVNAGKRSIAIDLGRPEAEAVKRRLLETADIIVETLRPGGAAKLGVGFEHARAANPKVVYCSISGFGRTGPYANAPGHDLAIQSVTGLLGGTFVPGEAPRNPPFHAADYAGATNAVIGVLAAYTRMLRTGVGGFVDISMYESLMSMLDIKLSSAMGRLAETGDLREIEVWGSNPRYRSYATKDGKAVTVGLLEASIWSKFCRAVDRPDLISENETLEDRLTSHGEHTERYREALTSFCASRTRDEIVEAMQRLGIPITPVLDQDEALVSDIAMERGVVDIVSDPVEGRIVHLVNPLHHSGMVKPRHAGPALGEHTHEVLAELQFATDDIAALAQGGVI